MNRRRFLTTTAVGTASLLRGGLVQPEPPGGYAAEAQRLTDLLQATFWDGEVGQFRAPVRSAETVDSAPPRDNCYVLWPSIEMLHALVAGESRMPGRYRDAIAQVVAGLEQYYDPDAHAYCAWLMFPGNNDKYYDDNALVAIALAEASRVTGEPRYRKRAREVLSRFSRQGWDDSGSPGGMSWGTDPGNAQGPDRGACSTGLTALAALLLAQDGIDRKRNIAWAREMLEWTRDNLQDEDGLIMDALVPPDWHVRDVKWTYNTGHVMRGWIELFRLTGDDAHLAEATRLGEAALDRDLRMYDGLVQDPKRKFFFDSGFFVAYLIDGLVELHRQTGDERLLTEAQRNADHAYEYLRDPADGLYFRNWRLWRIGEGQYETWCNLTGQRHRLEPDPAERSMERTYDDVPVAQRPLVKTLLPNAGVARLFWALSDAPQPTTPR